MNEPLERVAPETVGIPSSAIQAFIEATETRVGGLHSLMLLRHGKVAAEAWWAPYAPERPHMLFSLSKSFTSTAVGLAVADGLLTVDDSVLQFFPDKAPRHVSRNLAAMRVRHLLSMNTGHDVDTTGTMIQRRGGDWARTFLSLPVKHKPGSHFLYNTGATYMLSAIVQRLTGQTVLSYLTPRIFAPLGITGATWETCPQGVNTGGFGLSVRTEDIARFGQLYLNRGTWQGQRLLPAEWVDEATAAHSDNSSQPAPDWQQGYGYQFWRCRHDCYRGDGAYGQYCLVMPKQDAVLAITSGVNDMQAVLDLVWAHLLPAMAAHPLPADAAAQTALEETLTNRIIEPARGVAAMPLGKTASGRFALEANDLGVKTLTLTFRQAGATARFTGIDNVTTVSCQPNTWQEGQVIARKPTKRLPLQLHLPDAPVFSSGGWAAENTFVLRLCYAETPQVLSITLTFAPDGLSFRGSVAVAFESGTAHPFNGQRS